MGFIFWPELIVTAMVVFLLLFGVYYVIRKWIGMSRRIEKLEQTVYRDDER
ncbi:hypothetical protein GCM10027018_19850 [Paenibacillus thermoaerophilus]